MNLNYLFLFLLIPVSGVLSPDNNIEPAAKNIVFKSTDGGKTWQDISEGLPEMQEFDIRRDRVFVNDDGIFLRDANGIYHTQPNAVAPFWRTETLSAKHNSTLPGKAGMFLYTWDGNFSRRTTGTNAWAPVYLSAPLQETHNVFQTAEGTLFIGTEFGILKSTNNCSTWNQVSSANGVMKIAESNGVLMATSGRGILRSTDNGENWEVALNEGGVGIAIEVIKGGFAAINYSTAAKARRVQTSYDGGKTWKPIDANLKSDYKTASIIQFDNYFLCGRHEGIFKSSDNGATWNLLLPSIPGKVFNLYVSGNVIYAVAMREGC